MKLPFLILLLITTWFTNNVISHSPEYLIEVIFQMISFLELQRRPFRPKVQLV
ncbi:unnamed protein product [Brassica oleracea var. botrytis]